MLSKFNGSNGIVLNPSPKSPTLRASLNLLTSSKIHFSGFGKFLEHAVIDDAENIYKKSKYVSGNIQVQGEFHSR